MKITNSITKFLGKNTLKIKKYSPEVLLVAGVIGVVSASVMACRATLKAKDTIEDAQETIESCALLIGQKIMSNKGEESFYSEEDRDSDKNIILVQSGVTLVKLYAPAVLLGAISIGAIIGGHRILKKRNLAIAAAYKTIDEAFKLYQKRVVDELGEEKNREFKYGVKHSVKKETVVEKDAEGIEKKVKRDKKIEALEFAECSAYARLFDAENVNFENDTHYNMTFLKSQQNYFNHLLNARGYVFLNEVYQALGFNATQAGQVIGWVSNGAPSEGDGFVDFGIFDTERRGSRDFVNGWEKQILLDFNVDGNILDLI